MALPSRRRAGGGAQASGGAYHRRGGGGGLRASALSPHRGAKRGRRRCGRSLPVPLRCGPSLQRRQPDERGQPAARRAHAAPPARPTCAAPRPSPGAAARPPGPAGTTSPGVQRAPHRVGAVRGAAGGSPRPPLASPRRPGRGRRPVRARSGPDGCGAGGEPRGCGGLPAAAPGPVPSRRVLLRAVPLSLRRLRESEPGKGAREGAGEARAVPALTGPACAAKGAARVAFRGLSSKHNSGVFCPGS